MLYCSKTDKKKIYPSPRETIKKVYITETSELLTEAERAGEKRRKETEDEERFLVRLIACLEGSFYHTNKSDVSFNDG